MKVLARSQHISIVAKMLTTFEFIKYKYMDRFNCWIMFFFHSLCYKIKLIDPWNVQGFQVSASQPPHTHTERRLAALFELISKFVSKRDSFLLARDLCFTRRKGAKCLWNWLLLSTKLDPVPLILSSWITTNETCNPFVNVNDRFRKIRVLHLESELLRDWFIDVVF